MRRRKGNMELFGLVALLILIFHVKDHDKLDEKVRKLNIEISLLKRDKDE